MSTNLMLTFNKSLQALNTHFRHINTLFYGDTEQYADINLLHIIIWG